MAKYELSKYFARGAGHVIRYKNCELTPNSPTYYT